MSRAAFLLLALSFVGCGYTTDSLLPAGIETIAIDVFDNDTFYREIEFDLTKNLNDEFRHRTAYRVTRRRNADALLSGRIRDVVRPTIIEDSNDLVSEQAVIVTVDVYLTDLRRGGVMEEFKIVRRSDFIVERGETLDTAFREVLEKLAEDIVNRLENGSFLREMGVDRPQDPRPVR